MKTNLDNDSNNESTQNGTEQTNGTMPGVVAGENDLQGGNTHTAPYQRAVVTAYRPGDPDIFNPGTNEPIAEPAGKGLLPLAAVGLLGYCLRQ